MLAVNIGVAYTALSYQVAISRKRGSRGVLWNHVAYMARMRMPSSGVPGQCRQAGNGYYPLTFNLLTSTKLWE
jgi:hypothetical protein